VIDAVEEVENLAVVFACFDGEDGLARRRQHFVDLEDLAGAIEEADATEAGEGEAGSVVLAGLNLLDPAVDVAADAFDIDVGTELQELDGAAATIGADASAAGQGGEAEAVPADESVASVAPFEDGADGEPLREVGGHVF
jgi:hypothetical protein